MSKSSILVIYNAILVDSKLNTPGSLVVVDGKIRAILIGECKTAKNALQCAAAILSDIDSCSEPEFYDAKGLTLMPSFIDMHVHFRYPGQTQKEDLDSGLHAAVAGGYGTVVLMPNTNPVVSDKALAKKIMEEHQIGDYQYDLTVPDLLLRPVNNKIGNSLLGKIFGRGK